MQCVHKDRDLGRCQQDELAKTTLCGYHLRRQLDGGPGDRFYEAKVITGVITPTDHWISEVELRALFSGRTKGDGRRIDAWTKR